MHVRTNTLIRKYIYIHTYVCMYIMYIQCINMCICKQTNKFGKGKKKKNSFMGEEHACFLGGPH